MKLPKIMGNKKLQVILALSILTVLSVAYFGTDLLSQRTHVVTVTLPSSESVIDYTIIVTIGSTSVTLEPVGGIYDNIAQGDFYGLPQETTMTITITIDQNSRTEDFVLRESKTILIDGMSIKVRYNHYV